MEHLKAIDGHTTINILRRQHSFLEHAHVSSTPSPMLSFLNSFDSNEFNIVVITFNFNIMIPLGERQVPSEKFMTKSEMLMVQSKSMISMATHLWVQSYSNEPNHKDPWMHNFDRGGVHKLAYFVWFVWMHKFMRHGQNSCSCRCFV